MSRASSAEPRDSATAHGRARAPLQPGYTSRLEHSEARSFRRAVWRKNEIMKSIASIDPQNSEPLPNQAERKLPRLFSRFPALTGKTWNHPVVIGDRIYLRKPRKWLSTPFHPNPRRSLLGIKSGLPPA